MASNFNSVEKLMKEVSRKASTTELLKAMTPEPESQNRHISFKEGFD